jgi:hypothetical protein
MIFCDFLHLKTFLETVDAKGLPDARVADLVFQPCRCFDPTPGRCLPEDVPAFAPGGAGLCPFPTDLSHATTDGPPEG